MSDIAPPTPEETLAAKRYTVMNLMRLGSIAFVALGIAIAQGVLELPYALGVATALGGLLVFFFGPPLLVRRWKAGDENTGLEDTGLEDTGHENTGLEDTGHEDTGHEDTGHEDT